MDFEKAWADWDHVMLNMPRPPNRPSAHYGKVQTDKLIDLTTGLAETLGSTSLECWKRLTAERRAGADYRTCIERVSNV